MIACCDDVWCYMLLCFDVLRVGSVVVNGVIAGELDIAVHLVSVILKGFEASICAENHSTPYAISAAQIYSRVHAKKKPCV